MSIHTASSKHQNALHLFDGELGQLHSLLLEMTDLLIYQLEQTMHALDYGDMELALKVVARERKVDHLEKKIHAEMEAAFIEHNPMGIDLSRLLSSSKIASELEKIGNAIVEFSQLTVTLFESGMTNANQTLESLRFSSRIRIMLDKTMVCMETQDSHQAYSLLAYGGQFENESWQSMQDQLKAGAMPEGYFGQTLVILQIMEALQRCGTHCRKIAEHLIFTLDGVDVRQPRATKPSSLG